MKYPLRILAGILVLGMIVVSFLTLTTPGLSMLAGTASSLASNDEQTVRIEGVAGLWSGDLSVSTVAVSDRNGEWLNINNFRMIWHPGRLFFGQLQATQIDVGQVTVVREPLPQENTNSDGGSLPISLDLQNIAVADLIIGEEIAGSQARLKIGAGVSLAANPLDMVLNLNASRTDGITGTYDVLAVYQLDQQKAEISATLQEADNGILSNLLQLENTPALWLDVSGTGPLADWQFEAAAKVNDSPVLNIDGALKAIQNGHQITVKGVGHPKELLPPAYRKLVGESFDLDVNVEHYNSGKVHVSTAKLDFEKFFLAAQGDYDPAGNNLITGGFQTRDASLNFADGIIPGLKGFQPRSIAFSVKGNGSNALAEIHADIPVVDAGDIQATDIRAHFKAQDLKLEELSGKWDLKATIASIQGENSNIARALSGVQTLTGNGELTREAFTVSHLDFNNAALSANLKARYAVPENAWQSAFNSQVKPAAMPEALAKIIREDLTISGSLSGDSKGTLTAEQITLAGGPLSGSGGVTLSRENLAAKFGLDISSLKGLAEGFDMAMQTQVNVEGTLKKPEIDFRLEGHNLTFNQHTGEDILLTIKGLAAAETPDLTLALQGNLDGQSITGNTRLYTNRGRRVLENLKIENGPNQITGNLEFDDQFVPQGKIDVNLPELATLAALALQEISGGLRGHVTFDHKNGKPHLAADLQSDRLEFQDILISGINATINAGDYMAAPQPAGIIRANRISKDATVVNGLDLKLALQQDWTQFDLATKVDEIPLDVAGRIKLGDTIAAEISKANAVVQSIQVALAQTAYIQVADGAVDLKKIPLTIGGGSVTVEGRVKDALNLTANISGVNAKLVNQFAPELGAAGIVSGQVRVTGTPAAPVVGYDMKLRDATTRQIREFGVNGLNIASTGKFANKRLDFNAAVTGPSGLKINGGGRVNVGNSTSFDMGYKGDIPFPLLAQQLSEQGIVLEGEAKLDVKVSGTPERPNIRGEVRSTGARLVHAESGIAIKDIAMHIAVADQKVRIEKMTGNLSTGGRISSSGQVNIAQPGNFPADISLKVNDGVFTDHKSITSNFDADIKLSGPLVADPLLSGTVNLNSTTVTIPERLPASIAKLDVKHKNANQDINSQADGLKPSASSSSSGLRLDLQINALRKIFIRGRGLDVELGGRLKLTNSISNPRTLGGFEIHRGRLSILGKRLDFTRGEMKFSGSMVPELVMRAETTRDQYTIYIDVTGQADNPSFRFSSSPALSEDEVLARLIFGRDLGSLSALQIVQLGQAVATLTGHGGNSSLLDKFQGLIKADDLDIKTDEKTGETTVGVGKYINDKIYVGVERGANSASGKARIDLNIGKGIKLRGEALSDGESKAGIFYEKEY